MTAGAKSRRPRLLSGDFGRFWLGQTLSNLGSSFTFFALPLLVFKPTGSPINLGITTAAEFVPYLLFGQVIGAWVDRVDAGGLVPGLSRTLLLIGASVNAHRDQEGRRAIRQEILDGLRYVLGHPVLRNVSAMMASPPSPPGQRARACRHALTPRQAGIVRLLIHRSTCFSPSKCDRQ